MMEMRDIVKIPVSREIRKALKDLGRKGETYDDVIRRLMKEAEG